MSINLDLKQVFYAPQQTIFDAFTDANIMKHWFAPDDMTVGNVEMERREGGHYLIEMKETDGEVSTVSGVIKTYNAPDKLQCTWKWAADDAVETLLTLDFRVLGDGTEVHLQQENFASEESKEMHREGWQGCFANLEAYLRENK